MTINWTTNEASDSQVEYGASTFLGSSTAVDAGMVTVHAQALNGLAGSTVYFYKVKSKDAAGNLAASAIYSFRTADAPDTAPPVISAVAAANITASTAAITWTTNKDSMLSSSGKVT